MAEALSSSEEGNHFCSLGSNRGTMAREDLDAGGNKDSPRVFIPRPIPVAADDVKLDTSTPCHATKAVTTSRTKDLIVMLAKKLVSLCLRSWVHGRDFDQTWK